MSHNAARRERRPGLSVDRINAIRQAGIMTDSLVTTQWLADSLSRPEVKIIDASWHMPGDGRDAKADFEAGHIPGAVFLDLGKLADQRSNLPMMVPDATQFAEHLQALGIGSEDQIILYDNSPFKTAARAWWMLAKVFGAKHVAILDGGYAKWNAEGRGFETGIPAAQAARFAATYDGQAVRSLAQIMANLKTGAEQVIDARSAARFAGEEPEARPGLVAGHIPDSLNLPYGSLFDENGCWKRGDALRAAFEERGVDLSKPIVTSCGSGITASILAFGAHLIGKQDVALYDGSWTEWGSDPSTPKAVGRA